MSGRYVARGFWARGMEQREAATGPTGNDGNPGKT